MRFFQPLSQFGFGRILAETRTHYSLSPGLISIEKPESLKGYSAHFDSILVPNYPSYDSSEIKLLWNLPDAKKEKILHKSNRLSLQPFYPSYASEKLKNEDYDIYLKEFLTLPRIGEQSFYLPIDQFESEKIDGILETDCSLIILYDLSKLFNNQRKLAEKMSNLRTRLSPDIGLYLPGSVSPAFYSFLTYIGIDFFDNSIAYQVSKNGYFLTENGVFPIDSHPTCYCSQCSSTPKNIFRHNEMVLKNALARVNFVLRNGTLRSIVEQDIHKNITFAATLRHLDTKFGELLRRRTPIISSTKVKCLGEESLNRPVVSEFRERVKERFRPHPSSRIIILLPCSARKPYTMSRSHIMFRNAIKKAGSSIFSMLSELIITSPLSVVPRELENIYPARFYDIPVAGSWSEEEIDITSNLLSNVLSHYQEDSIIINHLHGSGYEDIIEVVREKISLEVIDTSYKAPPTSHQSLQELSEALVNTKKRFSLYQTEKIISNTKKIQAIADFQYGPATGKRIFHGKIKLKGRYPKSPQIFRDNKHIATMHASTGYLSLFPAYTNEISEISLNKLDFGADYVSGSNIYAPGCLKADTHILPEDEIFVMYENDVIATARAFVSGEDMNKMTSGKVAEIKKKKR